MDDKNFHTVRGYQMLENDRKLLTASMEDYLEMIYRYIIDNKYLRINKLAELLNVQASSATKMVQKLAQIGLIDYQKYGIVFLTEKGSEIGSFLLERHNIVEAFLRNIGVTSNLLIETELIEHNISTQTLTRLELFNEFISLNPDIFKKFNDFTKENS